ncbi:hypothetical protein, partial [Porphyromonas loveana]|uniref:hypothetical protein n=1 Tax=Porphyromonas loveana TaxID=1884669 RepID=UPI0035A1BAC4
HNPPQEEIKQITIGSTPSKRNEPMVIFVYSLPKSGAWKSGYRKSRLHLSRTNLTPVSTIA